MLTVDWDLERCIHSGECCKRLPAVFKLDDGRFIIDESQAEDAEIMRVVGNCPSGALQIQASD